MEPVLSERESGAERFARAGEISERFLDNIETVVYGKRDEIKLVLTALMCVVQPVLSTGSIAVVPRHQLGST